MQLADRARPLPRRRRHGRDGALQLQDGDRADRVDQHHLRRHQRLHRADPGERLHPQDASAAPASVKNPYLEKAAQREVQEFRCECGTRSSSRAARCSISTSSPSEEKDCFKTSFEIDQRWLIELAADRTPYIDQASPLNLFIPADVEKWDLLMLHFRALGARHQVALLSPLEEHPARRLRRRREADNTIDLREIQVESKRL